MEKKRIWAAVGIAAMVMLSAAFAVPPKVEGLAAAGSAKSALRPAKRDLKDIDEIIIHCSATPEGKDFTAADIDRWHRAQGWCCIGYHFVIRLDGTIEIGRRIDEVGAHCRGHNERSIAICYIGGTFPRPLPFRTGSEMRGGCSLGYQDGGAEGGDEAAGGGAAEDVPEGDGAWA